MGNFCGKCGAKVEGQFCSNCGNKITDNAESVVSNNDANEFLKQQMINKKNHNTYRLVVGIVMIILGFCVFIASMSNKESLEAIGYNSVLGFMLPGLFALAGGILSIISRNDNKFLLYSGICYVVTALCNMIGIENISLLFILCCIFAPLNFVFCTKANKE